MCDLDNHEIEDDSTNTNDGCGLDNKKHAKKRMNVTIIGVKPGDEIELNHYKNYFDEKK